MSMVLDNYCPVFQLSAGGDSDGVCGCGEACRDLSLHYSKKLITERTLSASQLS